MASSKALAFFFCGMIVMAAVGGADAKLFPSFGGKGANSTAVDDHKNINGLADRANNLTFNVNGVVSANGHLLKTGLAGMAGYYAKEVPYQMAQGINGAIRGIEKKLAGGRKARMMM